MFINTVYLHVAWDYAYLTRVIMAGKKWRFWPKSAIFFLVNNFPRHNKIRRLSFLGFWGVWVMKLSTLLLICSINIFNYLFEQYMSNYTYSILEKSEKVKDKVIIF